MTTFGAIVFLAVVVGVSVTVFLVFRAVVLWYWRVDRIVELLERIDSSVRRATPSTTQTQETDAHGRQIASLREAEDEARREARRRWGLNGDVRVSGLGVRVVGVSDPGKGFVVHGKGETWSEAFEEAEKHLGQEPQGREREESSKDIPRPLGRQPW